MYRKEEYTLMNWLTRFSVFCLAGAFLCAGYYFYHPVYHYRNLALILLLLSLLFQVQIYMYKMSVIEKRMLHLVGPSEQHFEIAARRSNLRIVTYFALFWAALLGIIFSFVAHP